MERVSTKMTIRNLVLSGGGPAGLLSFGALRKLAEKGYWKHADIKRIYGCSVGSWLACLLALDYDWDWSQDFLVGRPWEKLLTLDERILQAYSQQGVFGEEFFRDSLSPLLKGKNLPLDITLKEFCAATGIDLYLATVDLNACRGTMLVELTPKTHGDLGLVKAIAASCALPVIFKPVHHKGSCFIDGGVRCLYPIDLCLANPCVKPDEVLCIGHSWLGSERVVSEEHNIGWFIRVFLQKILADVAMPQRTRPLHEVLCDTGWDSSMDEANSLLTSASCRLELIERGAEAGKAYLTSCSEQTDLSCRPQASHQTQ